MLNNLQKKLQRKFHYLKAQIPDDRVHIALEPECAAVYIHKENIAGILPGAKGTRGLTYLLVDIGGKPNQNLYKIMYLKSIKMLLGKQIFFDSL